MKKNAVPTHDPKGLLKEYDTNEPSDPLRPESAINPDLESPEITKLRKELATITTAKKKIYAEYRNVKRNITNLKKTNKIRKEAVKAFKSKFHLEITRDGNLKRRALGIQTYLNSMHKLRNPDNKIFFPGSTLRLALRLYKLSPPAYRYLRKTYNNAFPAERTLKKYDPNKIQPGFAIKPLVALRQKVLASLESPLVCSLLISEIPISQKKSQIKLGAGAQKEKVTHVQMFMIVALKQNWKLPVAYFQSSDKNAEKNASLIKLCIEKCFKIGVRIVSITIGASRANFGVAEALGCQFSDFANMKTHFSHPITSENIYVFIDPSRIKKLVKRTFEDKKIFIDEYNERVRWQILINLNRLEQNPNLRFGVRDIHFRNLIIKTKLATQLLSMNIIRALAVTRYFDNSAQFEDSSGIANFVTLINNFFDVLNSQCCHFYGYKCPIKPENKEMVFKLLDTVKKYIFSLKFLVEQVKAVKKTKLDEGSTTTIKNVVEMPGDNGFVAALICIESFKNLYREMVEVKDLMPYFAAHRVSLDHLELFFRCIRKHGDRNPNEFQVWAAYKRTFNHLKLKLSSTSCIPIDNFIISTTPSVDVINSTSLAICYDDEIPKQPNEHVLDSDVQSSVNCEILAQKLNTEPLVETSKLMVGYISCYVAFKLLKELRCEDCVDSLMSNTKLWHHKLLTLKDIGGLCLSTESVFKVCLKTEAFIKNMIKDNGGLPLPVNFSEAGFIISNTLDIFLDTNVFDALKFHSTQQPCTFNHRIHLIRAIIAKYSSYRLHHKAEADPDLPFSVKWTKLKFYKKLCLF